MSEQKLDREKLNSLINLFFNNFDEMLNNSKPLINESADEISEIAIWILNKIDLQMILKNTNCKFIDPVANSIRKDPIKAILLATSIGAISVGLITLLSRSKFKN